MNLQIPRWLCKLTTDGSSEITDNTKMNFHFRLKMRKMGWVTGYGDSQLRQEEVREDRWPICTQVCFTRAWSCCLDEGKGDETTARTDPNCLDREVSEGFFISPSHPSKKLHTRLQRRGMTSGTRKPRRERQKMRVAK